MRAALIHPLRILLLLLIASSVTYAAAPSAVRTGDKAVLRNDHCSLTLDARTGAVTSLTPGPASLSGPWFEVVEEDRAGMRPWETWKHGSETTFSTGATSVDVKSAGGVATATMVWTRPSGLRVTGEVALAAADPGPRFRLTIVNPEAKSLVDTVRLPVITGLKIGESGDDWFTWPHTLGTRFRVDGFRPGDIMESPYPGFLYMQWLDLYDQSAGVYVGCLDSYGYSKSMFIGRDTQGRSRYGVSFSGCWVAKAGDRWTTPWVQVAAHKGDWRAGADMYRPFAEKAFGPINPPDLIEDMPTAQCWLGHQADNSEVGNLFEIQQQAPIHASYLMKSMNTSVPEGWDGVRGSGLDYHEAFDKIHSLGGAAALFTFDRAPLMGQPNYADYVADWTCRHRDGSIEEGFRDMMPSPFAASFRKARVDEAVRWVRDFGLDEIHYDTEGTCGFTGTVGTGLLAGPSYRMDMPQRPNEIPHYFKLLYRETVDACKRYNPNFTLRAEHCADFFFPEFSQSTAHFFEAGNVVMARNWPKDAQMMPELLRYTLPKIASLEMPSMSDNDFWVFGCGMGYGFHGGGPSWPHNHEIRSPEQPGGTILDRYRFYDMEWRQYYDFRVGFREAVVDAKWSDIVAESQVDGKWTRCTWPGPLVAVTHSGGGREVTLGTWYPSSANQYFSNKFAANAPQPRAVQLRIPTRLAHPRVRLHGVDGFVTSDAKIANGMVQLTVQDPRYFAVEVYEGPAVTVTPPSIAYPGETAKLHITVDQIVPAKGEIRFSLPKGWPELKPLAVPAVKRFETDLNVRVPAGIFGRNYPIKAVFTSGSLSRTVATHVRVMDRLSVLYSFDALKDGKPAKLYGIDPNGDARLTVTCVNNTPERETISIRVNGAGLNAQETTTLEGVPSADLGLPGSDLCKWTEGNGAKPANALVHDFDFKATGSAGEPVRIYVQVNGKPAFASTVYPRMRVLDLSGEWQVKLTSVSRANVAGVEGWDRLDSEAVTPDVWDGNWKAYTTPVRLDEDTRKGAAWGIYRKLVYIPAEWQGTDIWFRFNESGAPWGHGGTTNIAYMNGYPVGRIWINGERNVSPFVVFGGWNLIAVASASPNCLVDPYLFVRNTPDPSRIVAAPAQAKRPNGAFIQLGRRCTGQGLTMPFIVGVPEDDCRRTNIAMGGEHVFIYFAIADEFANNPGYPMEVEIEYLDEGTGSVGLDYDSTDTSAPVNGAFKSAPTFKRTGTGKWLKRVFSLPDAKFASREHQGSDFRIMAEDNDLRLRRVEVRRAEGK